MSSGNKLYNSINLPKTFPSRYNSSFIKRFETSLTTKQIKSYQEFIDTIKEDFYNPQLIKQEKTLMNNKYPHQVNYNDVTSGYTNSKRTETRVLTNKLSKNNVSALFPIFEEFVLRLKEHFKNEIVDEERVKHQKDIEEVKSKLYDLLDEVDVETQDKIEQVIQDL